MIHAQPSSSWTYSYLQQSVNVAHYTCNRRAGVKLSSSPLHANCSKRILFKFENNCTSTCVLNMTSVICVLPRTSSAYAPTLESSQTLNCISQSLQLKKLLLRHSSQIGQPMELFHCPPSAAAVAAEPSCPPSSSSGTHTK